MLQSGIPGQKIGFTLFLPFELLDFSVAKPSFLTTKSSPAPLHLSGCKIASPV